MKLFSFDWWKKEYNCPCCSAQIKKHSKECPACGTQFEIRKHKWLDDTLSSIHSFLDKWKIKYHCPYCSTQIEKHSKECHVCGGQFEILKHEWLDYAPSCVHSFLDKWIKKYHCPYCSTQIKKHSEECYVCGSQFKIRKHKWSGDKPKWSGNKPSCIHSSLNLEEYGIPQEIGVEILSNLPDRISPERFTKDLFSLYEQIRRKRIPEELGVGFILDYLASNMPDDVLIYAAVKSMMERAFSNGYDDYLIDYCLGGGWFPSYLYTVSPVPHYFPIHYSEPFIAIWHDAAVYWYKKAKAFKTEAKELCCFTISPSQEDNITPSQMEIFWSSLQDIKNPVSFEIIGEGNIGKVVFQLVCSLEDKESIVSQLQSNFSNINFNGDDYDYLSGNLESVNDITGKAFGLSEHYSYPLRTFGSFQQADPLTSLVGLLSQVKAGEVQAIQALIYPIRDEWDTPFEFIQTGLKEAQEEVKANHQNEYLVNLREGMKRYGKTLVVKWELDDFNAYKFKDCPIDQKRKYPLYAVCLKAIATEKQTNSKPILDALSIFSVVEGNKIVDDSQNLIQSRTGALPLIYNEVRSELSQDELKGVFQRQTYRHGFILNSQELSSLLHFPSKALQHPKLLRQESGIAKAPKSVTLGGLLIGVNEVHGKTGTGKTTLLLNMIKSDIDSGKGVGLIDPHGDLVERVLQVIPENRIDDVILFDPTDYEHPIGFNMFQVSDRAEERQMRSDIVVAIRQLFESSSWGDNIDHLFRTSVATLLADQSQKHTILDLRKLISDDVYRSQILARLNDDYLKEFWVDDFPGFAQSTVSAVKRRLASVLGEPEVRNILGQSQNSFSFRDMMDTKKIFLANLSRGILGENISGLFGGLLVSKIQLTAMARASQAEEERVPFYLYVDEFQNFVNESFEVILSEARKYKLCLTITHQFTGQLPSRLYDAVFGNIGSLIVFEVGVDDATALEKQLGKFSREDILNLERFHTFTRIGKSMDTFSMRTFPDPVSEKDFSSIIRQVSRDKYCSKQENQPVNAEEQVENDKTAGIDDFFERDK